MVINGKNIDTIVGIGNEGEEKILAGKMTTYDNLEVWTRISVTELEDGTKVVMWLNPDQDGAIQVNEKTAELFMSRFLEVVRDGGQEASIDNMHDGKITLEVPYAKNLQGGPDIKWQEETLDLTNIELRMIQSPEEWQEFAKKYPDYAKLVFSSGLGRSGYGMCMTPKDGGGTLLVFLGTSWMHDNFDGNYDNLDASYITHSGAQVLLGKIFNYLWEPINTFAFISEGENAFVLSGNAYPMDEVIDAFTFLDYGFVEVHNITFSP